MFKLIPCTVEHQKHMSNAHLQYCKSLIEEHLSWGNSSTWNHQDFEALSDRILEETGQMISATTLKRIWGRVTYNSQPSQHSLNTLARVLGYPSWREFYAMAEQQNSPPSDDNPVEAPLTANQHTFPLLLQKAYPVGLGILFVVAIAVWFGFTRSQSTHDQIQVDREVTFNVRSVAEGVPNTVVFEYDVSGVQADSFFLQQSWDARRRSIIKPDEHAITSIYYYPGYYKAKLVANDSILVEHPVHVTTSDWLALIHQDPEPVYFPTEALTNNGTLSLSHEWLTENKLYDKEAYVGFYNVGDFSSVAGDNFSLETQVKNNSVQGTNPCKRGDVSIRGENSLIQVSWGIAGCSATLHLIAGDVYLHGSNNDLSAFGADFSTFQDVRITVRDQNLSIQIGSNPPFETTYKKPIGKIVGIWYGFEGSGAVNSIRLKDQTGTIRYESEF